MATWLRIRSALGVLVVAGGIVGGAAAAAAQEPSSPIVDTLELDETAVVDHVAANTPERGGGFSGGEVRTNELFIRFWPDQNVADVFLSLMVVGEIEGCPASWSTLNQTTSEPVVVDSSGTATATIAAQWVFERQLPSGGATCLEKVLVAEWVEDVSIDLSFSEDAVSVAVKSENGTSLLAPAVGAAPDNAAVDAAELPTGEIIPGVGAASPPDEFGDGAGDGNVEPPAESNRGLTPTILLVILMGILAVLGAIWLAVELLVHYFRPAAHHLLNETLAEGIESSIPDLPVSVMFPDAYPDPAPRTTTVVASPHPVYVAKPIEVATPNNQVVRLGPGYKLLKGEPVGGRTPIFREDGSLIGTIDTAELRRSEVAP
jgi:hypothetical protein